MRIGPEVAQALADVANIGPALVFDVAEVTLTWPNGTRLTVGLDEDDRPELAYALEVR